MEEISFEEAIKELEEISNKLEVGEVTLEESLDYFQRGVELSKICSKQLKHAKQKIVSLSEAEKEENAND